MTFDSPIGPLSIATDERGRLTQIHFGERDLESGNCDAVLAQLREYFAGGRKTFDVELAPKGTPFQLDVWNALCEIPYGDTITYAELARRIGRPAAVRAVGAANGANPIPVIVPCHRVIGTNGTLTGYGGGIDRKQFLLTLEGRRLF
ncbi:MAG: methylated-DNA-[protein]-cysteine S-methyltransferase [Acidobacteriota bacterium]|jgi:methylated-DNA-[protein]-cysteine S-methyltransferase|nr:methylated-DNA-[protein]-cysteine S-methyltransferase [Acidobacteriota bacterium]